MADEADRTRLIGEISRVIQEPATPESTRCAALTLIGWLARRMPGEKAHALGVEEARESERRLVAASLAAGCGGAEAEAPGSSRFGNEPPSSSGIAFSEPESGIVTNRVAYATAPAETSGRHVPALRVARRRGR